MNEHIKKEIQTLVEERVKSYRSQKEFAESLSGTSEATIIQIRKGNWANVSDAMWRNIGKQVGYTKKGTWQLVETKAFKTLVHFFSDAKEYGNVFAVVADPGGSKTAVSEWFSQNNQHVYHLECSEYWNKKVFLEQLMKRMGRDNTGYNVAEMMDTIVSAIMKQEEPLLILDEADKLRDEVLYFFITLYNKMKGKCGIMLLATDYLRKRIERGRRLNRKGYAEIYSRLGRKFIVLEQPSKVEVTEICKANGLEDPTKIAHIYNECDGDLRRVERMVHRHTKKAKK